MKEITVNENSANKRLDEFLFSVGATSSRSKAKQLIKDNGVLVNDKIENAHYIVQNGDLVKYEENTKKPLDIEPVEMPLDIVFEDDDIIVINKPAGLLVHPGAGHFDEPTLINGLIAHGSKLAKGSDAFRPGLVHRIDKDTSGLLCVAKNDEAYEKLKAQLSDHSMHREYIALVKGIISENKAKIDGPIGRDPKNPTKFAVNTHEGKESITYFDVLARYKEGCTLVSCRLLTGRTHQIRVHMDYIGHPVEGDPLYGKGNHNIYDKGQLLHAYRLSFKHPRTGLDVSFEAPLPSYFTDVLNSLHKLEEGN